MDFRKTIISLALILGGAAVCFGQPQAGDIVLGLGDGDGMLALELLRDDGAGSGMMVADSWDESFLQGVVFDNLNGISKNPQGNLLAVTFGTQDGGGTIHSLATCSATDADQRIGDTVGMVGGNVELSRLGGISVSPDNTRIAVTGYDTGRVLVFDYTAGNCQGSGASLSNARETASVLDDGSTQGTTWLDSDTVLAYSALGEIIAVNANDMTTDVLANLPPTGGANTSNYTSMTYDPTVSSLVFASTSTFDNGTTNHLYAFEPTVDGQLDDVVDVDLSPTGLETDLQTARGIALGPNGALYISQFNGSISVIENAALGNITPTSPVLWYQPETFTSFNDIAATVGNPLNTGDFADCDFNEDESCDIADLDLLVYDGLGGADETYDLIDDGTIDTKDRDEWWRQAGIEETGTSYPPADITLDNKTDIDDLNQIALNWGRTDVTSVANGDMNGDGAVGPIDLNVLALNWNSEGMAAAAVPEPTMLGGLLFALLAFAIRLRMA